MRISTIVSLCAFLAASIGHVHAQSINIDVDIPGGQGAGVPSSAFAAAGLPGAWNGVTFNSTAFPLVDVTGTATSATFTNTGGFPFTSDSPSTSGDDELLLDDTIDPGTSSSCTIANLAAGTYTVLTYAWAPDSATYISGVSVNGGSVTTVGGVFSGTYVQGTTHARDVVTVAAGGSITITLTVSTSFATFNGLQIVKQGESSSTCSPGSAASPACPCGTNGAVGRGCPNSTDPTGAVLASTGNASIAADTFVLSGAGMPASATCLYFQGTAFTPAAAFGDGLNCIGGTMTRLSVRTNAGGVSAYPVGAETPISVRGGAIAGALRGYQVLYRDAPSFCTSATFNMTNGVAVAWAP